MSWYAPEKYIRQDLVDYNKEAALLQGELSDHEAKVTLAKFLRRNIGFTVELMTGIKLAPYQIITVKGMLNRNYSLCVWGRGVGKTFSAAIYCILQCVFEPNTNILIAGPTFRTARFIFTHIENISEKPEAKLLFDCMGAKIKRNDEFRWNINGGSIVAIPLNGEKIRGFRANVLVIDEFLLMSEEMVEKVLMPYLVAPQDIGRRIKVRAKEDELISKGLMKEEDREVFTNNAKMIALSSASYKCEYLYRKFDSYLKAIYDPAVSENGVTFFVSNLAWNAIPTEMMDKSVIEVAQSDAANTANFTREYGAQFIDGSDSYFSMNKMIACTVPDGQEPTLLLKGRPNRKYIISIDPNASDSNTADHFAMTVGELDEEGDGATAVHFYARAGESLKNKIKYFHYLLTNFNVVMIVGDHAGLPLFIEACNENELFINSKINLKIFEFSAEKDGEDLVEALKQARKDYNPTMQKIVFTQVFSTDSIRKMNEWLQGCFELKKIWFGGIIKGNSAAFQSASNVRINPLDLGFEKESTIDDVITEQEVLCRQTKYQCASIEVTSSAKGTLTFDLPLIMKRDNSSSRMRKDSYTALLLLCWGIKQYHDILKVPVEQAETFMPFFI